jgi:hypothetical protein
MNSEQTPDTPPANPNSTNPSSPADGEKPAKPGANKVLLLAVAFGIALLVAAGVLFVGLGKL